MADTTRTVELILKARDEASGPVKHLSDSLATLHEHMSRIKDIALGSILGTAGVRGFEEMTRGVVDFGKSLIESNAEIESMRNRLNILYGNAAEGAQAFAFLKQNELIKPFDIQSIMEASTRLVAFKQDITTLLPAIEDIAGSMGQSLQRVAIGFDAALAGRFAILRNIGISKQELASAGAQFDKGGHLTDPSSLARAFIELSNTQFKGGADKMAQTWNGLMSSMSSQWFYFKSNLGQGAFAVLEKQLHGIVHALQDSANSANIQRIETTIGAGLAQMTVNAINFGRAIGPYVGSAIAFIARAWPLVEQGAGAAFGFVSSVVTGFANWLQGTGFPAIVKVLNALITAWQDVAPPVMQVLGAIGDAAGSVFGAIAADAAPLMQGLAGAFKVGLGAAQAIFGGGLDLLSGNWAKFQNDFNAGGNLIMTGAVQLFGGVVQAMVPLSAKLFGPWTTLAQGIRAVFKDIGAIVGALVGGTVSAMYDLGTKITQMINRLIDGFNSISGKLHLPTIDKLFDPEAENVKRFVATRDYNIWGLNHDRPAGFTGPWNPWQNYHGPGPMPQIQNPGAAMGQGVTDWFSKHAPGIDPWQKISPGKTDAQAQADIGTRIEQILAQYGLGTGAAGKKYAVGGPVGQQILDQIKSLFKGLGGGFTMPELLKALGLSWDGKNITAYTPPPGGLPVAGYPTDPTLAGGATGGAAGQRAVTGRVALGNLGATFMSNVASLAAIGQGTDPATRAAQAAHTELAKQSSQGARQLTVAEQQLAATHALHDVMAEVKALLSKAMVPTATSPDPMRRLGVARPRVS